MRCFYSPGLALLVCLKKKTLFGNKNNIKHKFVVIFAYSYG